MARNSLSSRLLEHATHQREEDRRQLRAARLLDPDFDSRETNVEAQRGFRSPQWNDEDIQRVLESSAQEEARRMAFEEERELACAMALSADAAGKCNDDDITQALQASLQDAPFVDHDPCAWNDALRVSCMDLGPRGVSQVAKALAMVNPSPDKQQASRCPPNSYSNNGTGARKPGEVSASQLSKLAQTGRSMASNSSQVADTCLATGSSLISAADSSAPVSATNAAAVSSVSSDASSRGQMSQGVSRPASATTYHAKRCGSASTPRANSTLPRSAHRFVGAAKPVATSGTTAASPFSAAAAPPTTVDKAAGRIRSSFTPRQYPRSALGMSTAVTPSRPSIRR